MEVDARRRAGGNRAPWLGCYYVYRSDLSHERPLGPFRSMLDALKAVQPEKPRRKRMVYRAGVLQRRSLDEDEPE